MKPITAATICLAAVAGLAGSAHAALPHNYKAEASAQKHCPNDTVVYGAMANRVYHMKGERYYGNMKDGRFVCKAEADAAGWHLAPNGQ